MAYFIYNKDKANPQTLESTGFIPIEHMTATGQELFTSIAKSINEFLMKYDCLPQDGTKISMSLIIGFPCIRTSHKNVQITRWTRGFTAKGVINEDLGQIFQQALDSQNLPITLVSIVEDSMATLVYGSFLNNKCQVAAFLGHSSTITFFEDLPLKEDVNIRYYVQVDWGELGDSGCLEDLWTNYDQNLFEKSPDTLERRTFERLTSYRNVNELLREILYDLTIRNLLFSGSMPKRLSKPNGLKSNFFLQMAKPGKPNVHELQYLLTMELGVKVANVNDAYICHYVTQILVARAGFLIGAGLAAILNRLKKKDITSVIVALSGSFFVYGPVILQRIQEVTDQLKHCHSHYTLNVMEDAACRGASVIATVEENDT